MSGWQRLVGEGPDEVAVAAVLRGVKAPLSEAEVPPELTWTLSRIPKTLPEVPADTDSVKRHVLEVMRLAGGHRMDWQNMKGMQKPKVIKTWLQA